MIVSVLPFAGAIAGPTVDQPTADQPTIDQPAVIGVPQARLPPSDPAALRLLAQFKEATGGAVWDKVGTLHIREAVLANGLNGGAETWVDLKTMRYALNVDAGPVKGMEGFDGAAFWDRDAGGGVHLKQGADRADAVRDAYDTAFGYLFPDRFPASITLVGEAHDSGHDDDLLRIVPVGGAPYTLSIDRKTHLIDRIVVPGPIETRVYDTSDYRPVAGLILPFLTRSRADGSSAIDQTARVVTLDVADTDAGAPFAMPASNATDVSIAGGKQSTTLPFTVVGGTMLVDVKLNGKGPFRLALDTGATNSIEPALARELGLPIEGALRGHGVGEASFDAGYARVARLDVGEVGLTDQLFYVIPTDSIDLGSRLPFRGLIGYELLQRLVATIDHDKHSLTLTRPDAFDPRDAGTLVPFRLRDRVPEVDGSIDGIGGRFLIDTGNGASLDLMRPFVEREGLAQRYGAHFTLITGYGFGGAIRADVVRVGQLKLGDVAIDGPVTFLTRQQSGAFNDPEIAGNVGEGILRRFTVTFDYSKGRLYLKPNRFFGEREVFNRTGFTIKQDGSVFEVVPGGPADQAGLAPGTRILSIDGRDPAQMSNEERDAMSHRPVGTKLRLRIHTDAGDRDVELTLRDVV